MRENPTVGIAGLGLIGASIGLRGAACGWSTLGWDLDAEHASIALELGAVGETLGSFEELTSRADILVLAAPLDATLALLESLAAGPVPRARLIVDVASVKAPIARAGATLSAFVPTHPIAGSERNGPRAARADLFVDRVWTYAPVADADAVDRARDFIEVLGARPYALASDEHDRIVALTSHLPQLVSVALGTRLGPEIANPDVRALCGTGMRSMLRLGASAWPVWRAIVAANRHAIAQEVRGFASVLSAVADAVECGRTEDLAAAFLASSDAVAHLRDDSDPSGVTAATLPSDERFSWIDGSHSAQR